MSFISSSLFMNATDACSPPPSQYLNLKYCIRRLVSDRSHFVDLLPEMNLFARNRHVNVTNTESMDSLEDHNQSDPRISNYISPLDQAYE